MDNLNILLFPITPHSPLPPKIEKKEIFIILDLAKRENYLKSELGSFPIPPTHHPFQPHKTLKEIPALSLLTRATCFDLTESSA